MTEAVIRKKPGMASVKDMPILQDGPPPGRPREQDPQAKMISGVQMQHFPENAIILLLSYGPCMETSDQVVQKNEGLESSVRRPNDYGLSILGGEMKGEELVIHGEEMKGEEFEIHDEEMKGEEFVIHGEEMKAMTCYFESAFERCSHLEGHDDVYIDGIPILNLGEEMAKRGINPGGKMSAASKKYESWTRILCPTWSQLASVEQRQGAHAVFPRNRFKIRRNHILEDAFNQMSALSEEDFKGLAKNDIINFIASPQIRVTFVNEFGLEEAGIDGGGIFKDLWKILLGMHLMCNMGYLRIEDGMLQIEQVDSEHWYSFLSELRKDEE
ncbi:hypothetical protein F3Y22_tig00112789pilonHSYRG00003 [Hibiscus syriacus]|uniref:HECT-type E3 ubiquitin transferase n=1 Tax=Hibiscus syriacus TaxID=106335 RepID=A0A6A2XZM5_HIBSY|nr:hypothetical protein F3Y22_tig00112789pilonHSYRG00003 [Hibiscus syriacus]